MSDLGSMYDKFNRKPGCLQATAPGGGYFLHPAKPANSVLRSYQLGHDAMHSGAGSSGTATRLLPPSTSEFTSTLMPRVPRCLNFKLSNITHSSWLCILDTLLRCRVPLSPALYSRLSASTAATAFAQWRGLRSERGSRRTRMSQIPTIRVVG